MHPVDEGGNPEEWTKEATLEFLNLLKNEPVLWNSKHPLSKSGNERFNAWKRIQKLVFENNAEVVIPDREILQDSASSSMQAYDYPITIIDETRPLVETPNQLKKELQQRDVLTEGRTADTSPPFLQSESSTEEQNNHSNEDDSNRQKKRKRRHNDNNSAIDAVSDKHSTLKMALSAISKNNDECQTFGNFVASSLRNLKSDANRRKLRLAIQKVILDISTLDDKEN